MKLFKKKKETKENKNKVDEIFQSKSEFKNEEVKRKKVKCCKIQ